MGFISALIDHLIANYPVDPDRVYAVGFSNGGAMAMQLACYLTDKIAAFGLVGSGPLDSSSGSGLAAAGWTCPWGDRAGYVPMLWIHGSLDVLAPWSSARSSAEWFAGQMGFNEDSGVSCSAPSYLTCNSADSAALYRRSRRQAALHQR